MSEKIFQEVVFGEKAHEQLLKGATILAKAVKSTMGPGGHNVIIEQQDGKQPLITKDGVTVARSINLKEKLPAIGAELLKEIAAKTNERAGDGTTSSAVLGYALLSQGIKMIATGRSSVMLKKGIDLACTEVLSFLKENSVPVGNKNDIIAVGTISANGDAEIGKLLADAIEIVGSSGIITVEPAKSVSTTLEVAEGMQFDNGYVSPFFVTNKEKLTCEMSDPYILITNKKISALDDIIKALELTHRANKALLIVADEIEGEALHTLIVNKMKNVINVCAIKAPSFGENRIDILQDLAIVTGGTIFDVSSEKTLKNITADDFGTCKNLIVARNSTTFVGSQNKEKKEKIEERISVIKAALQDGTLDELRTDRYRKRLAKLSGGVAIVKVGGSTEVEILEKKDRVEDALNATIAASQEGIVPGGGTALFFASQYLRSLLTDETHGWKNLPEDIIAGIQVVINACESPLRTIVENTGISSDVVITKLLEDFFVKNLSFRKKKKMTVEGKVIEWENPLEIPILSKIVGYNALTQRYEDLIRSGILDPVKVTRYALEHACSVVGLMLTCDSVIVDVEESTK